MVRGCHPLASTGMAQVDQLRNTLEEVCAMKFIYKIDPDGKNQNQQYDDELYMDDDGDDDAMPALSKVPSYMRFDFVEDDEKVSMTAGVSPNSKGSRKASDVSVFGHVDGTDFDGITDPMPSTKALLQEPSKSVPYKKGRMFKRGVTFMNMGENERTFIYKHRTLYWIKDDSEEYPRSRIKFDQVKLKREDSKSVSVKTPRKEYILRCEKSKDMDEWYKLFDDGRKAQYLTGSMINRMTKYSTKPTKLQKSGSSKASPSSSSGLSGLFSRMEQHKADSNAKAKSKGKGKGAMKRHSDPPINTLGSNKQNSNSSKTGRRVRWGQSFDERDNDDAEEEMSTSKTRTLTLDDAAIDSAISPHLKEHTLSPGTPNSPSHSHSFSPTSTTRNEEYVTVIGPQDGDSTYEFAYGFLRDIVYSQMLFNQRKQLHTNALKYIAKCLDNSKKNNDKLSLLHTRHIECVQRYSTMLSGDDDSADNGGRKGTRRSLFWTKN